MALNVAIAGTTAIVTPETQITGSGAHATGPRAGYAVTVEAKTSKAAHATADAGSVGSALDIGGGLAVNFPLVFTVAVVAPEAIVTAPVGSIAVRALVVDTLLTAEAFGVTLGTGFAGGFAFNLGSTFTLATAAGETTLTAALDIEVLADSSIALEARAGQLATSSSGAFGSALAVNFHLDSVDALVAPVAMLDAGRGIRIIANSAHRLDAQAVGMGSSTENTASGSVAANNLLSRTWATSALGLLNMRPGGPAATAGQRIDVRATSLTTMDAIAGAPAVSAGIATGGSASVGLLGKDTQALINGGAKSATDIAIQAISRETVLGYAGTGKLAPSLPIAGGMTLYVVAPQIRALIGPAAYLHALGNVLISTDDATDLAGPQRRRGPRAVASAAGAGISGVAVLRTNLALVAPLSSVVAEGRTAAISAATGDPSAPTVLVRGLVVQAQTRDGVFGHSLQGSGSANELMVFTIAAAAIASVTRAWIGETALVNQGVEGSEQQVVKVLAYDSTAAHVISTVSALLGDRQHRCGIRRAGRRQDRRGLHRRRRSGALQRPCRRPGHHRRVAGGPRPLLPRGRASTASPARSPASSSSSRPGPTSACPTMPGTGLGIPAPGTTVCAAGNVVVEAEREHRARPRRRGRQPRLPRRRGRLAGPARS